MVTEKAANAARTTHSDQLFRQGVHSLAVDQVEVNGTKSFAVVAMVSPDFKHEKLLPTSLSVTVNGQQVSVPVLVKKTEPFTPE